MSNNQTVTENTPVEIVAGQIDLFTEEVVAETAPELTLEEIVTELTNTVFGSDETITAYKIAKVINGVFKATETSKEIPPQMMYNYALKGMLNGVKGQKQFSKDEVTTYVLKYTGKHVQ